MFALSDASNVCTLLCKTACFSVPNVPPIMTHKYQSLFIQYFFPDFIYLKGLEWRFEKNYFAFGLSRWLSWRGSLVWWRRPMSWVFCVTVKLPLSSSTAPTSCSSMPAQTWTKCCLNTQSTTNPMRAEPIPTLLRWVTGQFTSDCNHPSIHFCVKISVLVLSLERFKLNGMKYSNIYAQSMFVYFFLRFWALICCNTFLHCTV